MRKTRSSNENEMVYEFLKMEIASDRYADKIRDILNEVGAAEDIITNGNIDSVEENAVRSEVLGRFRGFKKGKEIFENFPSEVDWVWSIFDEKDIMKIKYINYSYWNELSNYTGSPVEAAKVIVSGKTVYDVPNEGFFDICRKLKDGYVFPPLIMLTDNTESCFYLLEGHARMTGYGIDPKLFRNVSVLLGYCDCEALKKWYGEMPMRP